MLTVVTCTGVPFSLKVMYVMIPKRARKSPKMLTNCAIQIVRNPGSWKTPVAAEDVCGSDDIREV